MLCFHFDAFSKFLPSLGQADPNYLPVLKCTSLILAIVASILQYSHSRFELLERYGRRCRKIVAVTSETEGQLEKFYFFLADLYRNILRIVYQDAAIDLQDALNALRICSMYLVYSETLNQGLLVVAKFASTGKAWVVT
jgi:hypothetical protein